MTLSVKSYLSQTKGRNEKLYLDLWVYELLKTEDCRDGWRPILLKQKSLMEASDDSAHS